MGSEQVAMVLRQSGNHVRLIVARPVEPSSPSYNTLNTTAPILPTRLLSDPEEIERNISMFQQAVQNGFSFTPQYNSRDFNMLNQLPEGFDPVQLQLHMEQSSHSTSPDRNPHQYRQKLQEVPEEAEELPEMETIDVQLTKDQLGLGITVAGYVCEKGKQIVRISVSSRVHNNYV
ncbi:patj homolog [Centruroides sculpturatus]|uniref:patj homolog n=1 Tax=Centruroides sculpturatus TaxID=218467 RepID=UPI000C6EC41B|nr:patj homolog [Centruroides sculpturatus]